MTDIKNARDKIQKLIERYNQNKDDEDFINNEKQACYSLIVPFIRDILHWNTDEPAEFKAEVSQRRKRIDYVVCNNGISQFIVEAKAPSIDIFGNIDLYKQAIQYGEGKEKDFAILTNFHQIIILGCSINVMPLQAELARINLLDATDKDIELLLYFEREYWLSKGQENALFSKLNQYKRKIPIDKQLLEDMKFWRELLLTNIKSHARLNDFNFDDENEFMHVEEEVQKFIDRLIFICFCEDKELNEPQLKSLLQDKKLNFQSREKYLLENIQKVFNEYKKGYDSDLFGKSDLDKKIYFDDEIIAKVLEGLRMPKDRIPYDFASIEVDILGKVYENFIGHIQSGKKRFKEKEDIGKRRKEGIYYTPKYVVSYIVNNSVREYIKDKPFEEIKKVKIIDPACGSGSFLLQVFDILIEESERKLKHALNYEEKKELMLNCIFGVDLDERAVAIAKLNLSLKMAERGQKLPMLNENIRLGNSLIDDKYAKDKDIADYKAFVWQEEFKDIIDSGGFDVVVGNPPYIMVTELNENDKKFFLKYNTSFEQYNIYYLFLEKAIQIVKNKGFIGFIVPIGFLNNHSGINLRKFILDNCKIISIMDVSNLRVFKDASTYPIIILMQKDNSGKLRNSNLIKIYSSFEKNAKIINTPQDEISKSKEYSISIKTDLEISKILFKIENMSIPLSNISFNYRGMQINKIKLSENKTSVSKEEYIFPAIHLRDVKPYLPYNPKRFAIHNDKNAGKEKRELFKNEKILIPRFVLKFQVAYSGNGEYVLDNIYILQIKVNEISTKYVLGVLNSNLIDFYYRHRFSQTHISGGYFAVNGKQIDNLPIKQISESKQQPLINLVDKILFLNKRLNEIGDRETEEKSKIKQEIKRTDEDIDEIVYKIYGITQEEKKIIEETLSKD